MAELSSFQLKDVAKICHEEWRYEMHVTEGLITWDSFKITFFDQLFPLELR